MLKLGDVGLSAGADQLIMNWPLSGGSPLNGCSWTGDSGGGCFVNGQLVGVIDFNAGGPYFGSATGATSVSQHSAWIDSQIVPEPGTLVLLGVAAAGFFIFRIKRQARMMLL